MLRRSERISTNANYQSSYAKLVDVTDAFKKIHKKDKQALKAKPIKVLYCAAPLISKALGCGV
jgi:hypothetical protein